MARCHKAERTIFTKLPFEIVDPSENDKSGYTNLVSVGTKKYALHIKYKEKALDTYNFEARPDDIYVVGLQRTGTTITSELVWLIENNLDFEGAAKEVLDYRFPHIDFAALGTLDGVAKFRKARKDDDDEVAKAVQKYSELDLEGLAKINGKRFIRSHLPLSLLSPHIFEVGAKIIYCARNPKDVIVSLYNFMANLALDLPNTSIQSYIDIFKNDSAYGYPFMEHVKEGWDMRNDKNFLFLFYEDTIKDKRGTIQKVAAFLGKKLSKDQIDILEEHLSIVKFKENKSVNWDHLVQLGAVKDKKFIRKGKVGGWKEFFDEKQEKEFDQVVEEKLKGMDFRFPNVYSEKQP